MIWRWLLGGDDLGTVHPWNAVISERHAAATGRLLLGAAGPARVVGNRIVEAREQRVAERRAREAAQREWHEGVLRRKVG